MMIGSLLWEITPTLALQIYILFIRSNAIALDLFDWITFGLSCWQEAIAFLSLVLFHERWMDALMYAFSDKNGLLLKVVLAPFVLVLVVVVVLPFFLIYGVLLCAGRLLQCVCCCKGKYAVCCHDRQGADTHTAQA